MPTFAVMDERWHRHRWPCPIEPFVKEDRVTLSGRYLGNDGRKRNPWTQNCVPGTR